VAWSAYLEKNRVVMEDTAQALFAHEEVEVRPLVTLVDFDPLDPSTYDRLAPSTLCFNYIFAAMAGVIWYFQFFFYSMGQTKMGKYDFSSWTLHMASIIIFATLWGLVLKEWNGTSSRTKLLVTAGLTLLIGSTVVVGYGNSIHAVRETTSALLR